MKRWRKFTPYIRRLRAGDKATGRTALHMALWRERCYVLVQRGFPRRVIWAAQSRREIFDSISGVLLAAARRGRYDGVTARDFRTWASGVRAHGWGKLP